MTLWRHSEVCVDKFLKHNSIEASSVEDTREATTSHRRCPESSEGLSLSMAMMVPTYHPIIAIFYTETTSFGGVHWVHHFWTNPSYNIIEHHGT